MALTRQCREARRQIIEAFRRLDIPEAEWSQFADPERLCEQSRVPRTDEWFAPPPFNRLEQSLEDWKAIADAAWRDHRDGLVEKWQRCLLTIPGVDEPLMQKKRRRGVGKTARNAELSERFEWAAQRLLGHGWKEIVRSNRHDLTEAEQRRSEDAVRKAATEILNIAEWTTEKRK
jgi:hypothetical protein